MTWVSGLFYFLLSQCYGGIHYGFLCLSFPPVVSPRMKHSQYFVSIDGSKIDNSLSQPLPPPLLVQWTALLVHCFQAHQRTYCPAAVLRVKQKNLKNFSSLASFIWNNWQILSWRNDACRNVFITYLCSVRCTQRASGEQCSTLCISPFD